MSKLASAKSPPADTPELDDLIGYNLKRAYVVVQNDYRRCLGDDGLSARVFTALSLVVASPQITQSALARMMGVERSGLVAIVDALEGMGYLQRVPVPGDRRVQALVPTEGGQAAYAAQLARVRDHEARLLSNLTPDEKDALISILKKIREREVE